MYVTPKVEQVAVILINTTNRNIWNSQPLLATNIYELELHPWLNTEYYTHRNFIIIVFQLVVPPEIEGSLYSNQKEAELK